MSSESITVDLATPVPEGTRGDDVMELGPGSRIGDYQVLFLLAEGGMAQIFAAQHPLIGKRVAIKVLNPQLR